ncbi:MAG: twin-arginine translocation signal domain-containing protein [Burkholderiales bacterium]|nr:twin-arginine translocation signal domain-containing protein [Burkholderiales bacterium]
MNSRRTFLQRSWAGTLGAAAASLLTEQASAMSDIAPADLSQLAEKVTSILPAQVCRAALTRLNEHMRSTGAQQSTDEWLSLVKLLHADDLAVQRVHFVQGLTFTETQIGILTSLSSMEWSAT